MKRYSKTIRRFEFSTGKGIKKKFFDVSFDVFNKYSRLWNAKMEEKV